jgi:hypothetical protein
MSELIQMENPNQSQAEMRAEAPEDDLLRALEESEGDLGKVNKPEASVEQAIPEVIPATDPVIQEVATPDPPITNPEDIMPRGFEFKPSPDAVKLPSNPTPNTPVAFVNPVESEPTIDALTKGMADSPSVENETNGAEALDDVENLTLEEEGEAVIARKKAEEVELASQKIVHTNSGHFIEDDSEKSGIVSPPPDGEDGLKIDKSLAQGSRSINIKPGGEKTMPPQQATTELNTTTPEPVVAEMSNAELTSGVTTPALDTGEAASESEVAQDSRVVSELVDGVGATIPNPDTITNPINSEVQEQILGTEAQPVSALASELPVAKLVTESVAPTPQEEIRSEVVSSEVPVEAPSPEPEADVIDFNQMREATAKANEGLVADIQDTQKNFEGKLTDAGVPETGSANFRTMQKETDTLGAELGAQIVDTQEKFENLLDKTEAHSQDILKNAQEVMAAASANIQRAQEERDRSEEILRIEEEENDETHRKEKEEIARKRSENEEKFSRIVEKNNPILERSHELIIEYSSSPSDQALSSESLGKTA